MVHTHVQSPVPAARSMEASLPAYVVYSGCDRFTPLHGRLCVHTVTTGDQHRQAESSRAAGAHTSGDLEFARFNINQ